MERSSQAVINPSAMDARDLLPGYFIAAYFSSSEAIRFVGSLCGVAAGFLISTIYFRITKKTYLPVVTEKKEEE